MRPAGRLAAASLHRPVSFASLCAVATLAVAPPAAAQGAAATQVPARVTIVPAFGARAAVELPAAPPAGYTGPGDHQYSLDLRAVAPATPAAQAVERLRRVLRGEPARPQPPRPAVVMVFE